MFHNLLKRVWRLGIFNVKVTLSKYRVDLTTIEYSKLDRKYESDFYKVHIVFLYLEG